MKVLFIADPLELLKPASDTTLAFLRVFFESNDLCFWACSNDVYWQNSQTLILASKIKTAGNESSHPEIERKENFKIEEFDLIFIRKEPPFDQSYIQLCQLLAPYEKKLSFYNAPSVLLRYHEKMLPLEALALGVLDSNEVIPTLVAERFEIALEYLESIPTDQVILKPWLGHGGRDVHLISKSDFSKKAKAFFSKSSEPWMLQAFYEKIYITGDRRVLYLGEEVLGSFSRIPEKGSYVSNLVRGGGAHLLEQSESEKNTCLKLGRWLKSLGIEFAGADFIDGRLSEVNITCPTGVQMWKQLTGEDLGMKICNYLKKESGRRLS